MDRNYYDDWADQYLKSAETIHEKIKKYMSEMKSVSDKNKKNSLDGKILSLWQSYNDLMLTADILRRKASILRARSER